MTAVHPQIQEEMPLALARIPGEYFWAPIRQDQVSINLLRTGKTDEIAIQGLLKGSESIFAFWGRRLIVSEHPAIFVSSHFVPKIKVVHTRRLALNTEVLPLFGGSLRNIGMQGSFKVGISQVGGLRKILVVVLDLPMPIGTLFERSPVHGFFTTALMAALGVHFNVTSLPNAPSPAIFDLFQVIKHNANLELDMAKAEQEDVQARVWAAEHEGGGEGQTEAAEAPGADVGESSGDESSDEEENVAAAGSEDDSASSADEEVVEEDDLPSFVETDPAPDNHDTASNDSPSPPVVGENIPGTPLAREFQLADGHDSDASGPGDVTSTEADDETDSEATSAMSFDAVANIDSRRLVHPSPASEFAGYRERADSDMDTSDSAAEITTMTLGSPSYTGDTMDQMFGVLRSARTGRRVVHRQAPPNVRYSPYSQSSASSVNEGLMGIQLELSNSGRPSNQSRGWGEGELQAARRLFRPDAYLRRLALGGQASTLVEHAFRGITTSDEDYDRV